jgi:hypothetical protein
MQALLLGAVCFGMWRPRAACERGGARRGAVRRGLPKPDGFAGERDERWQRGSVRGGARSVGVPVELGIAS